MIPAIIIDLLLPENPAVKGIHNGNKIDINRGRETKAPK
jgi:hypothetical protein